MIASGVTWCQGTFKKTRLLAALSADTNLLFVRGAVDSSPTHREGHRGIHLRNVTHFYASTRVQNISSGGEYDTRKPTVTNRL